MSPVPADLRTPRPERPDGLVRARCALRCALRPVLPAALAALALGAAAAPAGAQYTAFGQNKVQYSNFRWQVMESRHFQLYYYEEEQELAAQALDMAESAYVILRGRFAMEVTHPIPLIVYSSHQDFEQTNVIPMFLPEGVAGLTEYAKGRVMVPFDGSLSAFRVTIQHELVHVFELAITERVYREHYRSIPLGPPLWVTEGLAVHWSEDRDSEADMVLRDMVISGDLPSIADFWRYDGTFTLYKLGQSVMDYIGENYGEESIRLLYERLWAHADFAEVILDALGVSQGELSERWAHELRRRYYPEVKEEVPASFASRELTGGGADFKPLPLPEQIPDLAGRFAFISPRDGYTNIYTASADGGRPDHQVESLVEGERRSEFESFHAFRSRMDVSFDGLLLFVSKHQGTDEIVVFSIAERRIVEQHAFPDLTGLSSPGWAPDGQRFVFSGLGKDGYSDLYLFDRRTRALTRLTCDRYQDLDPSFCPWTEGVVWSSDRTPYGSDGATNLFFLDLASGEVRHLTRGRWKDRAPVCDAASRGIYFVSDRAGVFNAYWIDDQGTGRQLTHTLEAILDPRPVPGERSFLASVFRRGRFDVRRFPVPDSSGPAIALAPADTTRQWDWRQTAPPVDSRVAMYRSRFTLDIAQGGMMVAPAMRASQGLQAAFSDMMGNHMIFVGVGNGTLSTTDFLRNFSASVSYVNLSRRLNYGLSVFHFGGDFYDELGYPYYQRRAGIGALLRYPMNRYERIETNLSVAYDETNHPTTGFNRRGMIGTHSVSYIRDTSLWMSTGPIDGQRFNLTAGLTLNLQHGEAENTALMLDWRRYMRLGMLTSYAVRVQGRWSEGQDPEIFLLGGSLSLRCWPDQAFAGTRTVMLNQELRVPLVRGLVLGLPFGNMELPGVQGAMFLDAGSAWYRGWSPPWIGSYGFGFRMGLGGYLVLRLDVGWRTDFERFHGDTHTDFFLGWNY